MGTYKVTTEDGKSYKVTTEDGSTDWKSVVGGAVKSSFQKPLALAKDLGTNPQTMANVMPGLLGTVGGLSPIPGGATGGTAIGQGLRYGALKALGKPQPSNWQMAGELGGSALGDVMAIPAMKKSYFGGQIGKIEKARGVPAAQDIPSIPMTAGQKSTGEFINEAVNSVKSSGGRGTPSYWLQIKDQVDRLYRMGKDEALTTLDKGRLKWLNQQVREGLNAAVPGRSVPAQALSQSQTIPKFIGKTYNKIPSQFRRGAAYGTGAGAAGITAVEIIKKLLGG